jgi:two-component system, LuxR family, sensor kinase FixL
LDHSPEDRFGLKLMSSLRKRLARTKRSSPLESPGFVSANPQKRAALTLNGETSHDAVEQRLAAVAEQERARIGQDLHDHLCQLLSGIKFQAGLLEQKLRAEVPAVANEARALETALTGAIEEIREIVRGLHPAGIESRGLLAALRKFASGTSAVYGIICSCDLPRQLKIDAAVATHLYRITQEAVHNAVRHGRASRVRVSLRVGAAGLSLAIEDNGSGFGGQVQMAQGRRGENEPGLGLKLMKYRARAIGGSIEIRPAPKNGTTVTCRVRRFVRPQADSSRPAEFRL